MTTPFAALPPTWPDERKAMYVRQELVNEAMAKWTYAMQHHATQQERTGLAAAVLAAERLTTEAIIAAELAKG